MCSGSSFESLINRAERHGVDVTALAFRTDGTSFGVSIRNMSYNGCLLVTEAVFAIGEKLRLAVPRMGEFRAQVRWASNEGKAGAMFVLEEISPHEQHVPPGS
jgi:hypothetical protein